MFNEELIAIDREGVTIDGWQSPVFKEQGIVADVLRLDKIHPVVSGNKWFKLKNYLAEAISMGCPCLLTFGGAYSNHIVATAHAAREAGLQSIGVIRGEVSGRISHTLQTALNLGMRLEHISRGEYRNRNEPDFISSLSKKYPGSYIIPEGGAGEKGIKGCREILQWTENLHYTDILCAVGTGTLFSGLVCALGSGQHVKGICILKGMHGQIPGRGQMKYCDINHDYHFGGYARKSPGLICFMNQVYQETGIPTDFVYTGKLFYAAFDLIRRQHFSKGRKLLIIHSVGLQGNLSFPKDILIY